MQTSISAVSVNNSLVRNRIDTIKMQSKEDAAKFLDKIEDAYETDSFDG